MKKKRIILIITMALAVIALTVGIILIVNSCNDKSSDGEHDGKEIVIGGDAIASDQDVVSIIGATDLYLTLSDTDVDVNSYGVTVVDGDNEYDAKLDLSGVTFGTQGAYKITWYYGDDLVSALAKVEKELLIFSAPTLINEKPTATYNYSQAFLGVYDKISAKDCFGVNLALSLVDDGGMFNDDGTVNIGSFTVKYKAYDRAGQVLETTRNITVNSELSVSLSDKYFYDVYNEFFYLNTSAISQDIVGVSIDEVVVSDKYLKIDEEFIKLDGNYIRERFSVGATPSIKLIFSTGTASSVLLVEDKINIGLIDGEIYNDVDGFDTVIRSGYTLSRLEVRRFDDPSLGIFALYDTSSVAYNNFDNFNKTFKKLNTKYTYIITGYATKGGTTYEQTARFKLVKNGFSVMDANTLDAYSNNPSVTTIERQREFIDDKCAYEWKAIDKKANTSNSLIRFNKTAEKGDYLTFDIKLTDTKLLYLVLFKEETDANGSYYLWDRYMLSDPEVDKVEHPTWGGFESYTYGNVKIYDQNGELVKGSVLNSKDNVGKWFTVEIKLQGDLLDNCGLSVYSLSDLNTGSVYLSNVTISKNSLISDETINQVQLEDPVIEDVFPAQ
jgi:hypothetical protein